MSVCVCLNVENVLVVFFFIFYHEKLIEALKNVSHLAGGLLIDRLNFNLINFLLLTQKHICTYPYNIERLFLVKNSN